MREARHGSACILVRRGHVLSVSRGADLDNWGLPGGGLDAGETHHEAALRELWEETGVDARAAQLMPVYDRVRRSGGRGVTYLVRGPVHIPPVLRSVPFEGYVEWLAPSDLLAPTCTFRDDNRLAFSRIGLI